jgi:Na+/pantothenate symporter
MTAGDRAMSLGARKKRSWFLNLGVASGCVILAFLVGGEALVIYKYGFGWGVLRILAIAIPILLIMWVLVLDYD